MRRAVRTAFAFAAVVFAPQLSVAQDASRSVAGGGISVQGWQGKIDAREEAAGLALKDSKLAKTGEVFSVTTGPAVTYWNPANTASGNYTVKATFHEAKYMSINDHPHPYGIMIGGNGLGTAEQSYIYCAAYGNGTYILRGMGPAPFSVSARRPEANPAINKAAGVGQPVSQEIALSVRGDKIECAINGTVVGSFDKAAVVNGMTAVGAPAPTAGRLKSTDGVYGFRFAHNTEGTVTGLTVVKH